MSEELEALALQHKSYQRNKDERENKQKHKFVNIGIEGFSTKVDITKEKKDL